MRSRTTERRDAEVEVVVVERHGFDAVEGGEPDGLAHLLPERIGAGFPQDLCVVHLLQRLHSLRSVHSAVHTCGQALLGPGPRRRTLVRDPQETGASHEANRGS